MTATSPLPLAGIRVLEFTHMVMGPACGMVLADLGADVIKVEPLAGDNTRRLLGPGSGFFPMFNRNKQSLAVDITDPRGREIILKLVATADIFLENFRPGGMAKHGLDYESLAALNERLIYVSLKGFLPGPYEERVALDEVVQMMGGLAYMTGPDGRPLRAGSSVNDIMAGTFGALAALAALRQRDQTGRGQHLQSALFENNVLLVAQHMLQFAITGTPAVPMPNRFSAWGMYDVFTVADDEQIFLGVVTDTQWLAFCDAFGFDDLRDDPRLTTNNDRVRARDWFMPELRARLATRSKTEIVTIFEARGLPYAPITRPDELYDDPHLLATGGLAPVVLPSDTTSAGQAVSTAMPLLPITFDGERLPLRSSPPSVGNATAELLSSLGYPPEQINALEAANVVVTSFS